ncbi:MAG: amidohydrolase [Planctomycetes bacterium]|nr:amidohydrolase [Planctomycetota bacterium]
MPRDYAVIDLHVHVQPWRMLRPEILERMSRGRADHAEIVDVMANPDRFLGLLDRSGIEKAALVNYVAPEVMGFTDEVNDWISAYCKDHRDRLIPVGSLHPAHVKDARAAVDRLLGDLGIRMVKIHPPHQLFYPNAYREGLGALEVLYRRCEEAAVPVMFHTGTSIFAGARVKYGDPIHLDDVAVDFPRLRMLLAHAGRPLWTETAVFLARRHPNVWLDLSSIPPGSLLEYLPKLESLADKCLWGTDWPAPMVPSMKANLDKFLALPLSDDAKKKILRDNALRLGF